MESGLRDRNNLEIKREIAALEVEVSMKSGLGDRNNR